MDHGSESQCSSTVLSWDLYVKGGDHVFNATGRANQIRQSWCLADLLDFQLPTAGTSQKPPIDPMQTHHSYNYTYFPSVLLNTEASSML